VSSRAAEPDRLENVWVQLEHGFAELRHGALERGIGALERRARDHVFQLLEVVARGEQVLDRRVMERVSQRLPLTLLRRDGLRHQALALRSELHDAVGSAAEHGGEQERCGGDPGQVAGLHEHEARCLGVRGRGVREPLTEVRGDGAGPGHRRDGRPETERDGDRDEKVREPRLRERSAGESGERRDRGDVDRGRDQRESLRDGANVEPGEERGAPRGEDHERDRERTLGGVGVVEPLAGGDQRERGKP
jgi:hypothetical protein